jgi:hypothetical protein
MSHAESLRHMPTPNTHFSLHHPKPPSLQHGILPYHHHLPPTYHNPHLPTATKQRCFHTPLLAPPLPPASIQASRRITDSSKVIEATEVGRAAVDALNQINDYFDQSDVSLQVER